MNDLDLMRDFRADVAPPGPAVLAEARAAMFRTGPLPAAPVKRRARWVWRLAPAGVLAAGLAVAAVAALPPGTSDTSGTTGMPGTPGESRQDPPAGSPAVAAPETRASSPSPEAARVLRLAAAEARREPALRARDDQFVYVESLTAWAGGGYLKDGKEYLLPPLKKHRQIWLAVDGKADGRVQETLADPNAIARPGDLFDLPLTDSTVGYRRDLPTDAKRMRAYLYADRQSQNPPDETAFTRIGDTLRDQYVPPASVAAIFEAAATIPGTTTTPGADLAGREGIAVSLTFGGSRHDLVFDPTTYRFLGEHDVTADGTLIGWTAQLKIAIVEQAGQVP
jgi:hypothetical protein